MLKIRQIIISNKKQENAVTLIVLVITIIILMILAGITVVSLTGENGLIGKSSEAKRTTEISEGLEQLEIAVNQSVNKRGTLDKVRLAKNLSKINGIKYINSENEEIDVTENTEINLTAKVKIKGYNYKINSEGKVSYKKEGQIDNEDVMNSPETYYGKYVTYTCTNDAGINAPENQKWQIFMADDTNIYLIASNYITRQYTGTKNSVGFNYDTTNKTEATATKMWFNNILSQYNANSTTTDIPTILSKLDKQNIYHKWMNTTENQTKNNPNEKAVASMLDVDVWSGYINATYSQYAIGGPTLEMFCKAYNETRVEGTDLLEAKEDNTNGYKIKNGESDPTDSLLGLKTGAITTTPNVDSMYFKSSEEETTYWLASPSSSSSYRLLRVDSGGIITSAFGHRADGFGFRPLVCLNSDVYLVENTELENTYNLNVD